MAELKKALLQEQCRLEKIIQKTKKQLMEVPQGTLRVTRTGRWIQYYQCFPGDRKKWNIFRKPMRN